MTDNTENKWEKKSERFEVRLPYSKKQAFLQACEDQGDTPSSAVRRFIDGYLRRADIDIIKAAIRAFGTLVARNKWQVGGVVTVIIAAVFIGQFMATEITKNKIADKQAALFSHYDANKNGVIDIGEISKSDSPLHSVLNIDGEAGISFQEFRSQGKMLWEFWTSNQSNVNNKTSPPLQPRRLVLFDISHRGRPEINSWELQKIDTVSSDTFDRFVVWEQGKSKPHTIMEHGNIGINEEGRALITMDRITTWEKVPQEISDAIDEEDK